VQRRAKVRLSCRRARLERRRKRACRRLVTGFFHTILTCRDGLKPRNFPVTRVTGNFRGSRRVGVMEFGLYATYRAIRCLMRVWSWLIPVHSVFYRSSVHGLFFVFCSNGQRPLLWTII